MGTADAALGEFPRSRVPTAVVELKGALTDLDRDRSNGRTAVQQCWDYLNALPGCPWGIVSNFRTIRLYHREKGTLSYEEFTLQELRRPRALQRVLLPVRARRAAAIATRPAAAAPSNCFAGLPTARRKSATTCTKSTNGGGCELIEHLIARREAPRRGDPHCPKAARPHHLHRLLRGPRAAAARTAWTGHASELPACTAKATNPALAKLPRPLRCQWTSGGARAGGRSRRSTAACSPMTRPSTPLTWPTRSGPTPSPDFGNYDFSEEVNVEVLGHLFERSITELEKLRVGGLFALKAGVEGANGNGAAAAAKGKVRRAKNAGHGDGAPPSRRCPRAPAQAVRHLLHAPGVHGPDRRAHRRCAGQPSASPRLPGSTRSIPRPARTRTPRSCSRTGPLVLKTLKALTVCDPACGSGAFLIRAYDALDAHYKTVVHGLAGAGMSAEEVVELEDAIPDLILSQNLYGVDLSEQAVEITQLALWIRSARKGHTLADLSQEHRLGQQPRLRPGRGSRRRWTGTRRFPAIFGDGGPGGFSCVIGNPPWERVKVQDREFFSLTDPATAGAVSASDRKKRIAAMPTANPELHASYLAARDHAQKMLDYRPRHQAGRYPLTGKGDVNLYMLFAELARRLVAPNGLAGLLVPSGIATDDTTKEFFSRSDGDQAAGVPLRLREPQ